MIRMLDLILSVFTLVLTTPIMLIVLLVLFFESKSPIFLQKRLGKDKQPFTLIKFRTMKLETPSEGTHQINKSYVTRTGKFLRSIKLDELPQLINVILGDMSLVGPRPCLPNQERVISERSKLEVFKNRPGITGLAQVNNIDMSKPQLLARTDKIMIENYNIKNYFQLILLTALGKGQGDKIKLI